MLKMNLQKYLILQLCVLAAFVSTVLACSGTLLGKCIISSALMKENLNFSLSYQMFTSVNYTEGKNKKNMSGQIKICLYTWR